MKLGLVLVLLVFYGGKSKFCEGFDYSDPSEWGREYPACNGRAQSPINIIPANTVLNTSISFFNRRNFFYLPRSLTIKNNGHAIQVDVEGNYVLDDPSFLPGRFKTAQFHFHWGGPNSKGSEHTVRGRHEFGEMHIVMYNTKYKNLGEAADKPDGLAVLAFFIKDNYPQENLAFNQILNFVKSKQVQYKDDSYTIRPPDTFSLETLIPPDASSYYRYKGSLTTPGCFESVQWTVFNSAIAISSQQARILRTQVYANPRPKRGDRKILLNNNNRPVQALNGRVVQRSRWCS